MSSAPFFPDFKPLQLSDRDFFSNRLWNYQPEISELTFTNLFMWRHHYQYRWSLLENWLLIIAAEEKDKLFALEPVGPLPRIKAVNNLLQWLFEQDVCSPKIERADKRLVEELQYSNDYSIDPVRDHFDYLYATNDLITLSGRAFHSKRNHLTRFLNKNRVTYIPLTPAHIPDCLDLEDRWCKRHHCRKNPVLCADWTATREALMNFEELHLHGAAIYINGHMEAFTFGEMLNRKTAVIHAEKASPDYHGIYAAINQMFCAHELKDISFVNREQDLGEDNLRKAKLSYHPVKLVEKYRIGLKEIKRRV